MAVYRLKHFAKAADYCDVTQPTLSSMIQKLEDELGVKIFDRKRQPIRPNTCWYDGDRGSLEGNQQGKEAQTDS